MAVLILLLQCMVIVYVSGNTHNTCPDRVLWRRVALTTCPNNPYHYHCLERIEKNKFETVCKRPLQYQKGVYPVLDEFTKNLDVRACPASTYQPRATLSSERSTCEFQKSKCSGEGQITHSNGTTTEDVTCRCDYRHGYRFVHKPVNTCCCIPSQEDCSCYRESFFVNQDNNCSVPSADTNNNTTNITFTFDVIGGTVITDIKDKRVKIVYHNTEYDIPSYNIVKSDSNFREDAANCIIYCMCIFSFIVALIYIWWRYHKYNGALKVKIPKNVYTENIGGTVILRTHVKEFGGIGDCIFGRADIDEIRWNKGTTEEEVIAHDYNNEDYQNLELKTLTFEDEAEYGCVVTNRAGHMFNSGPIKVTVLGSNGRVLLQNIPEEIQEFGKAATEEYKRFLKTEVYKQKMIHLVFFGPEKSGKTSVWHNLLNIEQEATIPGFVKKYCVKIQEGKCSVTEYSKCKVNNIIKSMMKSIDTGEEEKAEVIDVIIREIPGQLEYCMALAPFVSRHAIFILTTDVNVELCTRIKQRTIGNPALEREPMFSLNERGELVKNWINIIHSLKPANQDSSTHLTLPPSMILVGTHKDEFKYMKDEVLAKKHRTDVLNCVYDKKSVIGKHIIHSCVISDLQSQSEQIKTLQDFIMKGSAASWHDDIPVRYFWFEDILLDQRSKTPVMTFDDVSQLGKDHGYPVTDRREFRSFLVYQHKVRNIIYWEEVSGYVIISPDWLYGIINKLITISHNETKSESHFSRTGQIAMDVLREVINRPKEGESAQGGLDTVEVLQAFDVIVRLNKKSSKRSLLYVPFVIPQGHVADVVTMFEVDRRDKTSFLSFSFDFLPAALVNHIMIRLIEKYGVCEVPSQNGDVAIYYRTLVLDYNEHKHQKLYFLSIKNELIFQIWIYGVQEISECFEDLRKTIEEMVTRYRNVHKMNLNFKHGLKCPDSSHGPTDVWDVFRDKPGRTYYCHDHRTNHDNLYSVWFTGTQEKSSVKLPPVQQKLDYEKYGVQETSDKPIITLIKTSYQVDIGSKVTLQCEVKSMMKTAMITWIRLLGNQEMKIKGGMKYSGGTTALTPSLTIYNITQADEGLYWCEARNSNGTTRSVHINVEVIKELKDLIVIKKDRKLGPDLLKEIIIDESSSTSEESFHSMRSTDNDAEIPLDINSAQVRKEHIGKVKASDQDEVVDAIVIHAKRDEDSANEFIDHLYSLKDDLDIPDLKVILHSDIIIPGVQFLHTFNGLFDKARFVMIIITERYKHSRLERFCAEKTLIESLMDDDKLHRVVPVSMAGPQHMPQEFVPLIAVQYFHYRTSELKGKKDKTYIRTLKKMFENGRNNYLVV